MSAVVVYQMVCDHPGCGERFTGEDDLPFDGEGPERVRACAAGAGWATELIGDGADGGRRLDFCAQHRDGSNRTQPALGEPLPDVGNRPVPSTSLQQLLWATANMYVAGYQSYGQTMKQARSRQQAMVLNEGPSILRGEHPVSVDLT